MATLSNNKGLWSIQFPGGRLNAPENAAEARAVMEMPWANRYGISQAIPPAYTEFIGRQIISVVAAAREKMGGET